MFKLQGQYHSASTRFAILVINVGIHNRLSKNLVNKNDKEVAVLVGICGTKQNELWRLQKRTWNVRDLKIEVLMFVSEILLVLQSRCFGHVYGKKVFVLKRYIMQDQCWILTIIESNVWMARGTWLGFEWGWWWTSYFTRKPMWNERGYELHLLE
jgi:hypothetical protein